eukprot:TRINITY_DN1615_c0_g1_i1.p1 TRINITY_DN1615_c0_g1~~TRINITY_DN1615_c0_g1_i1.p1  ORF type:complete len:277 (-),score=88.04 TRINITY_DN1615_c0_g1_i1:294-1124(-)
MCIRDSMVAMHLIPISANPDMIELISTFTVATVGLTFFLFAVAGLVELTGVEFKQKDWAIHRWSQIKGEMMDSLSNPPAAIFTTMAWSILVRPHTPSADMYPLGSTELPSLGRIVLEVACVFWAADIFIYFEHQLMHTAMFYKSVHKTHHTYHVPSAFAGFANHPLEAVFFTFASLWVQLFVAIHPLSHGIFGVFGATWTILSHDARSYHDKGFHYQHHFYPNRNFGAFTPIWDNLFGTRHVNPEMTYQEEVDAKRKLQSKILQDTEAKISKAKDC